MNLKDVHYLYEIKNRVNDKRYFGVTNNYKTRMYWHQKNLADGEHSNSHLQRAYNLYGPNSFEYNMLGIAECEVDICLDEMAAIWEHYPNCYNKLLGVPWTKYTPQTSIKKEVKENGPLYMARVKKAKAAKKKAKKRRKEAKKLSKARKRQERRQMLKNFRGKPSTKVKPKEPVINKISESDMHELKMDALINKARMELKR